jgi:hypothetical protein
VDWLRVKALRSSLCTTKQKQTNKQPKTKNQKQKPINRWTNELSNESSKEEM